MLDSEDERVLTREGTAVSEEYEFSPLLLESGSDTLIFSVYAKSDEGMGFDFHLMNERRTIIFVVNIYVAASEFQHHIIPVVFELGYSIRDVAYCRLRASSGTGTLSFERAKLEIGDIAAD